MILQTEGLPKKRGAQMANVLVSRCLLGERCRWHGKIVRPSTFVKKWLASHGATPVPVCPELLGGLGCPREPVKRMRGRVYTTCPEKKRRREVTGVDVTRYFLRGAAETEAIAQEACVSCALFCKWSPSCDITGITGRLLTQSGIEVINTW